MGIDLIEIHVVIVVRGQRYCPSIEEKNKNFKGLFVITPIDFDEKLRQIRIFADFYASLRTTLGLSQYKDVVLPV